VQTRPIRSIVGQKFEMLPAGSGTNSGSSAR
jgi:hypothetical protein